MAVQWVCVAAARVVVVGEEGGEVAVKHSKDRQEESETEIFPLS